MIGPRSRLLALAVVAAVALMMPREGRLLAAEGPAPSAKPAPPAEQAQEPSEGAKAAGAEGAPESPGAAKRHASRIARNFVTLMGNSWKDAGWFTLKLIISAVAGAVILFFCGGVLGYLIFRFIRRRGLLDAPFGWYRYARWAWPVLFVVMTAFGLAWGGLWIGGGRVLKKGIREDHLIEKVAVNLIVAVCLENSDYQLKGNESTEEIEKMLSQSNDLGKVMAQDFEQLMVEQASEQRELSFVQRFMVRQAVRRVIKSNLKAKLHGVNPGVLILLVGKKEQIDKYGAKYPNAHPVLVAFSDTFAELREGVCSFIGGLVTSNVLVGLAVGPGGPLAILGIWTFVLWLIHRRGRQTGPPPPQEPPPRPDGGAGFALRLAKPSDGA